MTTDVHPLDIPASLKRTEAPKPAVSKATNGGDAKPLPTGDKLSTMAPKPVEETAVKKRASPKKAAKKPVAKKRVTAPKVQSGKDDANVVTLKALCAELKIHPREARVKLRAAVDEKRIKHASGSSWKFEKGSSVLKTVRALLSE